MLDSDAGKDALGGSSSGLRKLVAYIKLASRQSEINEELITKRYELVKQVDPDRIVYNGNTIRAYCYFFIHSTNDFVSFIISKHSEFSIFVFVSALG